MKSGTKLDFETRTTYMVTITATDSFSDSASIDVTITVTDVDEAPKISEGGLAITGPAGVDYAENGMGAVETYMATGPDADMAAWSLSGEDMSAFSFSNDGMLTFRSSPDYENPADMGMDNMYMVTITADDGTYMDTHDVMVRVTNEDEPGRVTFWRDGADATTAAIMVGDMLGGLAEDPDGNVGDTPPITDMYPDITGATWQWAKTMTPDMMDSWMDITGATDAAYTVMDADEGYHLRATAMYDDGEGMGKMASEQTMMVTMNAAPEFADSEDGARSVAENTAAGEYIGTPVAATDANDDTLTYALGGANTASFDIDPDTGQLMTLAALDFETKGSYEVMVTASDSGGLSDSIDVTITVTNEDEMGEGDPVGGGGCPHDGAAGWRHNHGGRDGPGRRRNRRDLAVGQDQDAGHDGELDAHHRRNRRRLHGDGRRHRLPPAGDGDVHGRGGHGHGHAGRGGDGHGRGGRDAHHRWHPAREV